MSGHKISKVNELGGGLSRENDALLETIFEACSDTSSQAYVSSGDPWKYAVKGAQGHSGLTEESNESEKQISI